MYCNVQLCFVIILDRPIDITDRPCYTCHIMFKPYLLFVGDLLFSMPMLEQHAKIHVGEKRTKDDRQPPKKPWRRYANLGTKEGEEDGGDEAESAEDDGWHVVSNAPSVVMMQETGAVPETSGGLFQKLGIFRGVLLVVPNASLLKCLNPLQLTSQSV